MSDKAKKGVSLGGSSAANSPSPQPISGSLAFSLVVIMLGILFVVVVVLLVVAAQNSGNDDILDYSKWVLSTLLGAFGAWIGAGAAYFFGKENLAESSRSTAEALKIQQEALRVAPKSERMRELAPSLTAMNKAFMFDPAASKKNVVDGLVKNVNYWWVPVLDQGGKGVLEDIIHARVFWDPAFQDNDQISKIVADIDTQPKLTAAFGTLHGASFFVKAALDDKIADVAGSMNKSGAAVGIIIDDKGKPTYCFTKQNLLTAQK